MATFQCERYTRIRYKNRNTTTIYFKVRECPPIRIEQHPYYTAIKIEQRIFSMRGHQPNPQWHPELRVFMHTLAWRWRNEVQIVDLIESFFRNYTVDDLTVLVEGHSLA